MISQKLSFLVVLSALNLTSLLTCFFLVVKIRKTSVAFRRRLFIRQIQSMLMADAVFHLTLPLAVLLFDKPWLYARFIFNNTSGHIGCWILRFLLEVSEICSIGIQLHMSITFICQGLRVRKVMCVMRRSILFVLPFALTIWLMYFFGGNVHFPYDPNAGSCTPSGTYTILSPLMTFVFVISSCAYIVALFEAHKNAPHSVKAKSWRMATRYPLNFLLTHVLQMIGMIHGDVLRNVVYEFAAMLLLSIVGSMNAETFFMQSRYSNLLLNQESPIVTHGQYSSSFNVGFSPDIDIRFIRSVNNNLSNTNSESE